MDKIKLVFPEVEKTELDFNEQKLLIKKYATPSDERIIINYAIQTSESDTVIDENSLDAIEKDVKLEYGFIGGVLSAMTNIDIDGLDIDKIVESGMWSKIKSAILNYHDLVAKVEKVSKDRKQEEFLESKLNRIIDSAEKFIGNISKMDLSTENIKNMVEQIGIGKEQLAGIYPVIQDVSKVVTTVDKVKKPKIKPTTSTS